MVTVALQFYLFGTPRFIRDDQPIDLSMGKAAALLAYLAVAHTPQPRDRVLALLWPESLAEAARKNLRNTLWAIRKAFGSDVLTANDDRLSLNSNIWIDVTEFERLAESSPDTALELYGGPLLAHLDVHDAPEFEIWVTMERERLSQIHLRIISQRLEHYRTTGDWNLISNLAHRALAEDTLNEQMYQALIEAHARLGERGEALRHYDTLRSTLSRELGVEPLPETERLRAMILNGGLEPVQPMPPPRRPPRDDNHSGVAHTPFIGRQTERAQLDSQLAIALSGQTRIVLLTGELGIGKSRLWQEWSSGLPDDLAIFETRCMDSTRTLPFVPLTRMFTHKLCMRRLAEGAIPPVWLAELARLIPEIRVTQPQIPVPVALPPEEERRRVFEAFVQLLSSMERLVMFIDDLHWADATTIEWLSYFINRWQGQGLLLVATYRQEEAPASLIRLVANLTREGVLQRIPLARLTGDESAQLLTALGGDRSQFDQLYAQSTGNPYFLTELVRATPGTLPPALAESVRARVGSLPDAARQVLQAAAVLEPDFPFNVLRRTSGRGEEEMLDALDTLLNAGLLVEQYQRYSFAHPLVAEIMRDDLSDARRAVLHRRAAEALEALYADRLPTIAGLLTEHYAQAHDADCAAHYAKMAAEQSLQLAAPAEAISFYRRALNFEPSPERQLDLGRALIWQGNLSEAQAAFGLAVDGFKAKKDRHGLLQAYLALADSYLPAGRPDQVVYWAQKSLTYLNSREARSHPAEHALALLLLGGGQLRMGHSLTEAEAHLAEAAQIAADNDLPDVAARSCLELGNLRAQRGDLRSALDAYYETIERAEMANNPYMEILGHNNVAYHLLLLGDKTAAHEHIDIGLALAEARAVRLPLQYLYSTRGEIALAEEHWDEAETYLNKGMLEASLQTNTEQIATYRANLSLVARGRGDLDGSLALLESARELAATLTAPHLQIQIDIWLAELFLARRERTAAQEALGSAELLLADGSRKHLHVRAEQLQIRLAHG